MWPSGFLSLRHCREFSSVQRKPPVSSNAERLLQISFLVTECCVFSPQRRSGQRVVAGAVVTPGGAARPSGAGTHAPVAQGPGQGLDSQRWISPVSTCLLQSLFLSSCAKLSNFESAQDYQSVKMHVKKNPGELVL